MHTQLLRLYVAHSTEGNKTNKAQSSRQRQEGPHAHRGGRSKATYSTLLCSRRLSAPSVFLVVAGCLGTCLCAPVLASLFRARGLAFRPGGCPLGFPAIVCPVTPFPTISSLFNSRTAPKNPKRNRTNSMQLYHDTRDKSRKRTSPTALTEARGRPPEPEMLPRPTPAAHQQYNTYHTVDIMHCYTAPRTALQPLQSTGALSYSVIIDRGAKQIVGAGKATATELTREHKQYATQRPTTYLST